ILKMIEYRFALKPLTLRDSKATNIASAFDWQSKPRLKLPDLPHPAEIVSQACPTSGDAQPRSEHDLMGLYTSGYLDHIGFDYKPVTRRDVFR
ncbi:MAG: Phospholipase, partial [Solirubrobacteraceae bacterium]|nr:Phospholipase [Solirubrobacteraceae bacterium]